jgi:hypothetical protein
MSTSATSGLDVIEAGWLQGLHTVNKRSWDGEQQLSQPGGRGLVGKSAANNGQPCLVWTALPGAASVPALYIKR